MNACVREGREGRRGVRVLCVCVCVRSRAVARARGWCAWASRVESARRRGYPSARARARAGAMARLWRACVCVCTDDDVIDTYS